MNTGIAVPEFRVNPSAPEASANSPTNPRIVTGLATKMVPWLRQQVDHLSGWVNDSVLRDRLSGSASRADVREDLAVLNHETTASLNLEVCDRAEDTQTPLSAAYQWIDRVAQHSVVHSAEWMSVEPETVIASRCFISHFYLVIVQAGQLWRPAHISSDAEGGVSFEWWNGGRTLTLFAHPDQTTSYLFAWGLDIWTEMETGENPDDCTLLDVWRRLNESE